MTSLALSDWSRSWNVTSLPPLIGEGLSVIFVGTDPGRLSLETGWYYANPTNGFYRHLAESGLTPRQLAPAEFGELLRHGIGLDDVYDEPSALRRRIESVAPRAVCFNSKEALRRFAGVDRIRSPWRAEAARRHAAIGEITWALTDSSWEASKYWPSRLEDLRALRHTLTVLSGRR